MSNVITPQTKTPAPAPKPAAAEKLERVRARVRLALSAAETGEIGSEPSTTSRARSWSRCAS